VGLNQVVDLCGDIRIDKPADDGFQETEIGWRIVEQAGENAGGPIK